MSRIVALWLVAGAGIALFAFGGANAQLANRPFMKSVDGKLSARLAGSQCAESVDFTFTGPDAATFNKDGIATRLMNNVAASIRDTCPKVVLISAKGLVGERIVYNAIAERATNWLLLELGSRDATLFSGASGTSVDKGNFARRKDFSAFGLLLERIGTKRFLCSGLESGKCTAITEFVGPSSSRAQVISRSLLDSTGTQAVLTYDAENRNGFLCSNPEIATIAVEGGQASLPARTRFASDLRERLKPYGTEVCAGYALLGGSIIGANFNSEGARIGEEATLVAQAALSTLRQGK